MIRFTAENYGPQERVDIELGDLVTLLVGPNNTGKSFVSRAIYAVLKSCRSGECDKGDLASLLLNSSMALEQDLWLASRNFNGRFSLVLEDRGSKFSVRVDYDRGRQEQLKTEVLGDVRTLLPLYAPAYRVVSLGLPYMTASYAGEFASITLKLLKLLPQITAASRGIEGREVSVPEIPSIESDLSRILVRSLLSTLRPLVEGRVEVGKALALTLPPTLSDLATAIRDAERMGVDERLVRVFRNLFPDFPYRALGFHHGGRADVPEIPAYLLSSGMMQALPILCLLNLALMQSRAGYDRVIIFIDEPEINLEMLRQARFSEQLMDLAYSMYREGRRVSLVIATHSDFIAYSITRWLARNNLRNLAKVYEFKPTGVKEREIDEHGEVKLETFSEALRKVFFEEEFKEES